MGRIKLLFMLLALGLTAPHAFAQAVNVQDSLALVDLYDSTNGPNWSNNTGWKKGPVSTWYGVTVTEDRVTLLYLSSNNLTGSLPESIGNLTGLDILDLTSNQLGFLPESIGNLTNLHYLQLIANQFSSLPESIGNLTGLQELDLSDNQFRSLPESFGNLKSLGSLSLGYNQLSSLPESIGNLTGLQHLDLIINHLSSLPASFGNLKGLQFLDLTGNQFRFLPESIGNLTNLQILQINANQFSSLPESFSNLTGLQELSLSGNQLSSMPASFGNLVNLQRLSLDFNQLSSLPQSFRNLGNLQQLSLNGNQLSSLPASFGNLTNLQILDFTNNKLTSLPASFGKLANLQVLGLSSNQFSSLPESFSKLKNLGQLYLNNNQLSSLPESIGNLTGLWYLGLYSNQLSSLPESFGNLTNLNTLGITGNHLTSLPESFGNLKNLQILALDFNQLSSLPASFGNLIKLVAIFLNNNKFTFATLEALVQHQNNIEFYYVPQDTFELTKKGNTLVAPVGGTPKNNTFYWYRNEKLDTTINADSTYKPAKPGRYRVEAHNAIATALVLYSDPVDDLPDCDTCIFVWYRDADGDGFGNPNSAKEAKEQPRGYVSNNLDCNDKNKVKGGPEVCDGIDNDCNGIIDDGLTGTYFYSDFDGDGYGTPKRTITTCAPPPRYIAVAGDQNDDNPHVYPGAPELCDGRDNNQDGVIDEGFTRTTFYHDFDKDGYGNPNITLQACAAPLNYVGRAGDCNDRDSSIHPGAPEIVSDGKDNNCNGLIDEPLQQVITQKQGGKVGQQQASLQLTAQPNPTTHFFTLHLSSASSKAVQLRIVDAMGRVVEVRQGLSSNTSLTIGHTYSAGVYYAEVLQKGKRASIKLVKQIP